MILDCYHLHHTKQNIYIPSLQGDPSGTFARRWHCASQDLKEWRHSSFRNAFQPHTLRPLKMNLLHDVATVMLLRDWCQHRFLSSIIIFYMCKHIYKLISWNWPINLLKDWLHKWLKWSTFTTAHGCFSNLGFHLPGHCSIVGSTCHQDYTSNFSGVFEWWPGSGSCATREEVEGCNWWAGHFTQWSETYFWSNHGVPNFTSGSPRTTWLQARWTWCSSGTQTEALWRFDSAAGLRSTNGLRNAG